MALMDHGIFFFLQKNISFPSDFSCKKIEMMIYKIKKTKKIIQYKTEQNNKYIDKSEKLKKKLNKVSHSRAITEHHSLTKILAKKIFQILFLSVSKCFKREFCYEAPSFK